MYVRGFSGADAESYKDHPRHNSHESQCEAAEPRLSDVDHLGHKRRIQRKRQGVVVESRPLRAAADTYIVGHLKYSGAMATLDV